MITKLAPVEYDPGSRCPAWLDFQRKVCVGSDSLIGFKQRLYGACLTGDVSDQVLVIFYGAGSNGKSCRPSIPCQPRPMTNLPRHRPGTSTRPLKTSAAWPSTRPGAASRGTSATSSTFSGSALSRD